MVWCSLSRAARRLHADERGEVAYAYLFVVAFGLAVIVALGSAVRPVDLASDRAEEMIISDSP